MTPGQQFALAQLNRLAATSNAIELISVSEPTDDEPRLVVEVSLYTGDMPRKAGGIPLRARERVRIWIDPTFPYEYPRTSVSHRRFAGHPHVNWGTDLCMYQAPQTEWSPRAGIIGFLMRLELWFRKAAINELDPIGGALHPPVAYLSTQRTPRVLVRADTPTVGEGPWLGFADVNARSEYRVDVTDWHSLKEKPAASAGPAILLDAEMPLEFPARVADLLECLEARGVSRTQIFALLQIAILRNDPDEPLYMIVGTPMRGVRGGKRQQHLTAWRVDAFAKKVVDLEGKAADLGEIGADLREDIVQLFDSWAAEAEVAWCRIREDRPQVTVRRDHDTPMSVFRGLRVEVWGCGALGAHVAEMLVRAGVSAITVRDNGVVEPGVLVRQPFVDDQVGHWKAAAVAGRLQAIAPKCEVAWSHRDVLVEPLADRQLSEAANVIIDTTASASVLMRIEELWRAQPDARKTVASIVVDRDARKGMLALATSAHSGGPYDVTRRLKLTACSALTMQAYADAFFPSEPRPPFQPEPGCSDATFVGSIIDTVGLASLLMDAVAKELTHDGRAPAAACFVSMEDGRAHRVAFSSDLVVADPQSGYETRLTTSAWRELQACVSESARTRGPDVETGGLLFGQLDEYLKVIWVSELSGPPPDSTHRPDLFECGVLGTKELDDEKRLRSRGSVAYIGTWHIHPVSVAAPSPRDLGAMNALLTGGAVNADRLLLMIVGEPQNNLSISAAVFERSEFERALETGLFVRDFRVDTPLLPARPVDRKVGLALSGGGSRAMAFHLGCLRALHDRGVLPQIDVVSTVSGGSVIGAMYAYSNDSFEDFEQRVLDTLRSGFVGAIAARTLLSPHALKILGTHVAAGLPAYSTFASRFVGARVEGLVRRGSKAGGLTSRRLQPPFRRWASRTDAFVQALRDQLFGTTKLSAARRDDLNVVINACELRTGTAFRFGNKEVGSWKYGTVADQNVDVAFAVAASAAFPLLLPALDRVFPFRGDNGETREHRVILTDGGVYENLGVTCMDPGKDPRYSTNAYRPPVIICCDAGRGALDDVVMPYGMATRTARSFAATHRQVQHSIQTKIHLWLEHGLIDAFVYSYLGQQDSKLPVAPPDLIRRSNVEHYPTDFSPMSASDIELLSTRGYQLTRLLIDRYCPQL